MPEPDPSHLVAARAATLTQTAIDGDLVALDVERGTCFGFNATAARIWTLLASPMPVSALVDRLIVEFAVDRERCTADLTGLLREMETQGLVALTPA